MNRLDLLNLFKRRLARLLEAVEQELARPARDPYAELDPARLPHEHDTRLIFVDELMQALGWRLGPQGDVMEEARLQADTTTFMDYVGVVDEARSPGVLVEAKAWGKPYISARVSTDRRPDAELAIAAIQHIRAGGAKNRSPVIGEWHDYLEQVYGYVRTLKERYNHPLPRAVLLSGEWLLLFKNPVATFLGAAVPGDVLIFKRDEFRERAEELFDLLHQAILTKRAPIPLRPTQLRNFLDSAAVERAFLGVHVHYEETGSSLWARRPRIQVYPALFIVRTDGAIYTVIDRAEPVELDYVEGEDEVKSIEPHLAEIHDRGTALVVSCGNELGGEIAVSPLETFSGFPGQGMARPFVRSLTAADEWLVATGADNHFLLAQPRVPDCRFHTWSECGDDAAGPSALTTRSTNPKSFFVDSQPHHCANRIVHDRRADRCLINAIDGRVCCQTCVYLEYCWTEQEREALPCGL